MQMQQDQYKPTSQKKEQPILDVLSASKKFRYRTPLQR